MLNVQSILASPTALDVGGRNVSGGSNASGGIATAAFSTRVFLYWAVSKQFYCSVRNGSAHFSFMLIDAIFYTYKFIYEIEQRPAIYNKTLK